MQHSLMHQPLLTLSCFSIVTFPINKQLSFAQTSVAVRHPMVKKVWVEEGKTLICLIGQSLNLASLSVGLLEAEEDLVAV